MKQRLRNRRNRKGAIAVLAAVLMIVMLAMVAFAVDTGYVMMAQSDLQRAADSAAHAAALEYRSEAESSTKRAYARSMAVQFATENHVLRNEATVESNSANSVNGDVVLGTIDMSNPRGAMTYDNLDSYNAVRVKIRRSAGRNGEIPLIFAKILGIDSVPLEAEATAAIVHNVGGFRIPASGGNVPFLPITIHEDTWDAAMMGETDEYAWDPVDQTISKDDDGLPEIVLYPSRTESSGNFGTVNVGISANSTSHLASKIRYGLNQSDLDFHGGTLELDLFGELMLSGDPGLSASVKDDLSAIAGEPRIIPLYDQVNGPGNNAQFRIVRFVGIRIMAVKLTGGNKFVSVQPADVSYQGVIQAETEHASDRVYSPPLIVQ